MASLNTMFKSKSNGMCNNILFNVDKMLFMKMHPTMERLYQAANELKAISGQSDLARLLNTSPQTVNNWEARGISSDAALDAEIKVGCSAVWLKKGIGKMHPNSKIEAQPKYDQSIEDVIKLLLDTDEIGLGKALFAVKEIVQMRKAMIDSMPLIQKTEQIRAVPGSVKAKIEQSRASMLERISEISAAESPPLPSPRKEQKGQKKL